MMQEFLWGSSTSSHQVEGNNIHNQWWQWEKQARERAKSGRACDHWNRFNEDFDLAEELGHTAHRLSIEWSRIEPKENSFNMQAVRHYQDVLDDLKRRNMKTFVTLHHFTNPLWFENKGGWESAAAPEIFERYVKFIAQHLGDRVDFWVTINEPMVYAVQSYFRGKWPPQKRSFMAMLRVVKQLAAAHKRAHNALHSVLPRTQVGFAKHLIAYLPEDKKDMDDRALVGFEDWWFNHRWFSLVGETYDFVGVNYYFTRQHGMSLWPPGLSALTWDGPKSDLDWPIRPEGLTHVLEHMRSYKKPIYITENGLANEDDSKRADFIRGHLRAVENAQEAGADVRGYMYWSLLDNFEWAHGFRPRFGLVEIDYTTLERKIRPSALVYREIIKQARGKI